MLERTAFWLIVASLGVVQFNLLAAQAFFGLAAICWVVLLLRHGAHEAFVPRWFVPLVVYAAVTLVSALGSIDRVASLVDCKQFVLFLMVPMVARFARGPRALTTLTVITVLGGINGLAGTVDAVLVTHEALYRPSGTLANPMTYAGLLMLVAGVAAALFVFSPRSSRWQSLVAAVALPLVLVALAATKARNAWVGVLAGLGTLLAMRRAVLLVFVPIVVGIFFMLAPPALRDRAYSIADQHQQANQDRIVMAKIGRDIILDHPWFGVGPDQIKAVYAAYRESYPEAVFPTYPHLHNVPLQIAAERGLPALGVWLWFAGLLLVDLVRQYRRRVAPVVTAAALAAFVMMLVAGMFEYNFGDSEFLMLFLGLVTLPFAAAHDVEISDERPAVATTDR